MRYVSLFAIVGAFLIPPAAGAETPDEWVALGARVYGGFRAFIPLGTRIGLDSTKRLDAKPRELSILYYDSDTSSCAYFVDGVAFATYASFGQRAVTMTSEKAPPGAAAVIVIRPRRGGAGFKYTIPAAVLPKLAELNRTLDPRGRSDAVMAAEGLFDVEPIP